MRKGVIVKLNKHKATLLTEDCSFYNVKAFSGMYQGMEVCFKDSDIFKRKYAFMNNKTVQAACFVLIVFCSYIFLSFYQENIATYAYVGIDINPSIEMSLNKKGILTDVRGLDEDGKRLAAQIDIKEMDSVEGVKEIIAKTIDMGYLTEENSSQITVYTIIKQKGQKNDDELAEKLKIAIKEEVVSHNINKEVKSIVSDKKTKDKADKAGISVSKYIIEDEKSVIPQNDKEKEESLKNDKKNEKKIGKEEDKSNKNTKIDNEIKTEKNNKESKYSNKKEQRNEDHQRQHESNKDKDKKTEKNNQNKRHN